MPLWIRVRWFLLIGILGFFVGLHGHLYQWIGTFLFFIFLCTRGYKWWYGLIIFCCCTALYTAWRVSGLETSFLETENTTGTFTGIVHRFPEQRQTHQRIYIHKVCFQEHTCFKPHESLILRAPKGIFLAYGDQIQFQGTLQKPIRFDGFDYRAYLERFGVYWVVQSPQDLRVIGSNQGNWFWQLGYKIRIRFSNQIARFISYPHNIIGTGVLLGVKDVLPPSIDQSFRDAGLHHIVVVSGFNVVILTTLVLYCLRRFGRGISAFGAAFVLGAFLLITGGDPPVVRATIMGIIALWGWMYGRQGNGITLLFLTALLMGAWNPLIVLRDISFQLSFMATAGILVFVPWFERRLAFAPVWIEKVLSVTLAAQLAVFPVLGWYFELFPLGGIVANVLVEPFIPLIMLGSFLSGIGAFVLPSLAEIMGMVTEFIITLLFWLAKIFGTWGSVAVPRWMTVFIGTFIGTSIVLRIHKLS